MALKEELVNDANITVGIRPVYGTGKETGTGVATIAAAASLSDAVDLDNNTAHALVIGSAWVAAAITFQVSLDGTTYHDLYDGSGEVTVASASVGANRAIALDPNTFLGFRYLKVRSGSAATPVAQTGGATVTVVGVAR